MREPPRQGMVVHDQDALHIAPCSRREGEPACRNAQRPIREKCGARKRLSGLALGRAPARQPARRCARALRGLSVTPRHAMSCRSSASCSTRRSRSPPRSSPCSPASASPSKAGGSTCCSAAVSSRPRPRTMASRSRRCFGGEPVGNERSVGRRGGAASSRGADRGGAVRRAAGCRRAGRPCAGRSSSSSASRSSGSGSCALALDRDRPGPHRRRPAAAAHRRASLLQAFLCLIARHRLRPALSQLRRRISTAGSRSPRPSRSSQSCTTSSRRSVSERIRLTGRLPAAALIRRAAGRRLAGDRLRRVRARGRRGARTRRARDPRRARPVPLHDLDPASMLESGAAPEGSARRGSRRRPPLAQQEARFAILALSSASGSAPVRRRAPALRRRPHRRRRARRRAGGRSRTSRSRPTSRSRSSGSCRRGSRTCASTPAHGAPGSGSGSAGSSGSSSSGTTGPASTGDTDPPDRASRTCGNGRRRSAASSRCARLRAREPRSRSLFARKRTAPEN